MFRELYKAIPLAECEEEPMLNILCWRESSVWKIAVFCRVQHRPSCFFEEGDANILITPASVDMGGVFIAPLAKDYEKVTSEDIQKILDEVCISESIADSIIETINK